MPKSVALLTALTLASTPAFAKSYHFTCYKNSNDVERLSGRELFYTLSVCDMNEKNCVPLIESKHAQLPTGHKIFQSVHYLTIDQADFDRALKEAKLTPENSRVAYGFSTDKYKRWSGATLYKTFVGDLEKKSAFDLSSQFDDKTGMLDVNYCIVWKVEP